MRPLQLYCPETLHVEGLGITETNQLVFLAHRIIYGWINDPKSFDRGPVRLKAKYLARVLGRDYRRALSMAIKHGVIEKVRNHSTAVCRSTEYNLAEPHRSAPWHRVTITDHKIGRAIRRWQREREELSCQHAKTLRRKLVADRLAYWLRQLTLQPFDVAALCRQHEDELREKYYARVRKGRRLKRTNGTKSETPSFCLDRRISAIRDQVQAVKLHDWEPHFCDYGRFHSVLTNLWGRVRPYLRCGETNEPLIGIDIKCSQPFFISTQLVEYYTEQGEHKQRNILQDTAH